MTVMPALRLRIGDYTGIRFVKVSHRDPIPTSGSVELRCFLVLLRVISVSSPSFANIPLLFLNKCHKLLGNLIISMLG